VVGFDFASGPDMTVVALVDAVKKLAQEVCGIPTTSAAPVFKVGDRFRTKRDAGGYKAGSTGVVEELKARNMDGEHWLLALMSDGTSGIQWRVESLEHLPSDESIAEAPAAAKADAEGWVAWAGGACPLEMGVAYEVKTTTCGTPWQTAVTTMDFGDSYWLWNGDRPYTWSVIAYRVLA
jgi:hypothetical protein